MNTRQVMESVAALASIAYEGREGVFCAALNRALEEIGHAFPKKASETIYHTPPIPAYASDTVRTVTAASPLRIVADGVYAFSFWAYGDGVLTVSLDDEMISEYKIAGDEGCKVIEKVCEIASRKVSGRLQLTLKGTPRLYLRSVALYDSPYEAPSLYSKSCRYPTDAFSHRFLAFDGKIRKNGRVLSGGGYAFEEDALVLPQASHGIYEVFYDALPALISEKTLDEEIFLREDAKSLLVPLTAYYVMLEDENPAADAMLSRYEALKGEIGRGKSESVGDVYGW